MNQQQTTIHSTDINDAISRLELNNKTVFIHGAIKSFGYLEGGPKTLIDAFIDAGCTVVMPTFTYNPICNPPPGWTFPLNGFAGTWDFDHPSPYVANDNYIEKDMGAIPKALLSYPQRIRSNHPVNSYAAIGPKAKSLMRSQTFLDVYGLYKQVDDAIVLTMGVTLTSVTPIHYAEVLAGRTLFRRWAQVKDENGDIKEVETQGGGCSNGFDALKPFVKPIQTETLVGSSLWTAYPFDQLIDECQQAIIENKHITHCSDDNCIRCNDIIKSQV